MPVYSPKIIKERIEKLKTARSLWDDHWREIADYMHIPRNDINVSYTSGQKRNTHLLNNTAMMSAQLLANTLHSELTSPNTQWFELTLRRNGVVTEDLMNDDEVKMWLQSSSRRMMDVFNNSNFQTEIHQYYLDLCTLCTSSILIEEDDEFVVRFATKHIKTIYISQNNKGIIDEVYREYEWDAANLVKEFGSDNLPKRVVDAWQSGKPEKFKVCHSVYPNKVDPDGKDQEGVQQNINFPFVSQYTMHIDSMDHTILVEGYNEMPYTVSRWEVYSGEIYGRGPGFTALPEAKIVNKVTETIIKSSQKVVDPPMMVPDDGFIQKLRTAPGSLNFYRSGSGMQEMVKPVFNDAKLDIGFEVLEQHQERIRQAFYIDQLQLVQKDRMTATETLQRTEENNRILSPLLGRQQHEFLRPLIDRVFGIMFRRGMFEEAPEQLRGVEIDVQYSSSIARAQRVTELNTMLRTLETLAPLASVKPEVMDHINPDGFAEEVFRIMNFPQKALFGQSAIDEMREGRQQAEEELAERARAQDDAGRAAQQGQAAASFSQAIA